jgi:MFS family permease
MLLGGRIADLIGARRMTLGGLDRGKALGVWSALAGVGSALGVILGGVLTSEAGWRWVFTVNVPIGAALLVAIPLAVPARPPSEAAERGLDVPGAVLVTAGTAAAIYGRCWPAVSSCWPPPGCWSAGSSWAPSHCSTRTATARCTWAWSSCR